LAEQVFTKSLNGKALTIMRKLWIVLTVFLAVVFFSLPAAAVPKAMPVDPVFEFSPLPEGEKIVHEFIVRNTGDTVLNITHVLPP
jgi:hypothetical protein